MLIDTHWGVTLQEVGMTINYFISGNLNFCPRIRVKRFAPKHPETKKTMPKPDEAQQKRIAVAPGGFVVYFIMVACTGYPQMVVMAPRGGTRAYWVIYLCPLY